MGKNVRNKMIKLNKTHNPDLKSWVTSANEDTTDFPIQNLPFGLFRHRGESGSFRGCTAIGDFILDLRAVNVECVGSLNTLASKGKQEWSRIRGLLSHALSNEIQRESIEPYLFPLKDVELGLPVVARDYTDFFTSYYHAYNTGKLFKPDEPVTPNFKWMPIAYHGRASSIVVSGTDILRPYGQILPVGENQPIMAPSRFLDFESELGIIIGPGNKMGETIGIDDAEDRIFGFVLLNDWSARDIQAWEYQPLGPFLSKSFATTISPWIITLEALAPFRSPAFKRFENDPPPLPHLTSKSNEKNGHFSIRIEAHLRSEECMNEILSSANYNSSYWNPAQLVVHHASNGCPMSPGDILGTGTISGPEASEAGAMLELGQMGAKPVLLSNGEQRGALNNGDTLTLCARCSDNKFRAIGFGEASGKILQEK